MTAQEFARNVYLEKLKFNRQFSQAIETLDLNQAQLEQLEHIGSNLLTDVFYTLLLGLDGCTSIGESNQQTFKLYDENDHLVSDCGELEAEAYHYFYEQAYEAEK